VTKYKEKAEALNAFFASVVISKTNFSEGIQPTELEDSNGEQIEARIIQRLATFYTIQTHTSVWGQMGFAQGYRRRWWKCSPSDFQSFVSSTG